MVFGTDGKPPHKTKHPQPLSNPAQRRPTVGAQAAFRLGVPDSGYIVFCSNGERRNHLLFLQGGNVSTYKSHSTLLSAISSLAIPTT